MRFRAPTPHRANPLRLHVDRYVHCPRRGGLVQLHACAQCELMQGTLSDDGLEVLCAYPEPIPALHSFHVGVMHDEQEGTSTSWSADPAGAAAPSAGPAAHPASGAARAGFRSRLIFETDWPDDD